MNKVLNITELKEALKRIETSCKTLNEESLSSIDFWDSAIHCSGTTEEIINELGDITLEELNSKINGSSDILRDTTVM